MQSISRSTANLILAMAVGLGSAPMAQSQTVAPPKMRVGLVPAVDRFVTLTDGSRVYQGVEITYLLGQTLLASSGYVPVMLSAPATTTTTTSSSTTATGGKALSLARVSQIPTEWTKWTTSPQVAIETQRAMNEAAVNPSAASATVDTGVSTFPVAVDLTVTPVVETLQYSSGQKSDRVFFGFSPDHLNPFNAGEVGGLDNQYVATSAQEQSCEMPDFFNGQLNAAGSGPLAGNFGANMDEGFSFSIAGYGLTYKTIKFAVQSQIRFLVDNNRTGAHNEYVFQTTGSGTDVFVDGSYQGYNIGFEIQRTHTLLAALQAMLPRIVNGVVAQALGVTWQSSIVAMATSGAVTEPILGAGVNEGVNLGLQLVSPSGNIYEVINVAGTTSTLSKMSGSTQSYVGEPLQVYTGKPLVWSVSATAGAPQMAALKRIVRGTASAGAAKANASTGTSGTALTASSSPTNEKIFQSTVKIPLNTTVRAASQAQSIMQCFGQNTNPITSTIDSLATLYAYWRYDNVFDQAPHKTLPPAKSSTALKIALIDSGADYNDSSISSHFVSSTSNPVFGYDFISWDPRPDDDNGHGTAAVKLLSSLVKTNFVIVPVKVIGAYGQTHSSAVYDAFTFAINNKVDAILVPWSSEAGTLAAYQMGAQNAAAAGIPVFVAPNTVAQAKNIYVPTTIPSKSYETSGLSGSSVQLPPEGVATVNLLAQWMTSKVVGGTK